MVCQQGCAAAWQGHWPEPSRRADIDASDVACTAPVLLVMLADQESACVRWPTRKGTRSSSGAETSPLMMAQQTPRFLRPARVLLLASGHQRATSASARVSKSQRAVARFGSWTCMWWSAASSENFVESRKKSSGWRVLARVRQLDAAPHAGVGWGAGRSGPCLFPLPSEALTITGSTHETE
jgi:hypothetical protein